MEWGTTAWTIVAYVLLVLFGVLLRKAKRFSLTDISPYNRFIFTVGMGCLAFKFITAKPYSALDWHFVLGFGAVRAFAALVVAVYTAVTKGSLGDYAVHLLASSWMDVNTFAGPFLAAFYGPTLKPYAALAAWSSFFFTLPLALICLEVHQFLVFKRAKKDAAAATAADEEEKLLPEADTVAQAVPGSSAILPRDQFEEVEAHVVEVAGPDDDDGTAATVSQQHVELEEGAAAAASSHGGKRKKWSRFWRNALRVGLHGLRMSPLVGIVIGIIWRACAGSSTASLPVVFETFVTLMGQCVPPLAAFVVGLFIADGKPFRRAWKRTLAYLGFKLVLLPICAIGIIRAVGLPSPLGQAAVIFSAMPIAFPSFAIVRQYSGIPKADEIMSTSICAGVILALPVLAIWWAFFSAVPIFPAELASSS